MAVRFPRQRRRRRALPISLLLLAAVFFLSALCAAHGVGPASCPFSKEPHGEAHHDHGGCQHHHHHHDHGDLHHHHDSADRTARKLPEELAEEEDLKVYGFGNKHAHAHAHGDGDHHHHDDHKLSTLGLWVRAMGCSLLVSMASLICLIILPLLFLKGKPSKMVVDSLAVFGAGAMLGDAFLHQLPHAFGGEHSHSDDHHADSAHDHHHELGHSHSHSLKDLSVGLSILSGIVLFLLVEKVVRYVEDISRKGGHGWGHGHHHHHRSHHDKKDDDINCGNLNSDHSDKRTKVTSKTTSEKKLTDGECYDCIKDEGHSGHETHLHKRSTSTVNTNERKDLPAANGSLAQEKAPSVEMSPPLPSSLVFGYLNLFSDGVHNFTDGMALGSAFLLYGSVGGWSRTLFLLAHELPQEVGDFGILVRSGFTVPKALFFNFLSALVALAGTALALLLGKDPGQSSLIEGFTAGGFIYIAVAGVLPEMNSGSTTFKSTTIQLTSLILGMSVAMFISLVE